MSIQTYLLESNLIPFVLYGSTTVFIVLGMIYGFAKLDNR